jgi:hypothetical protein
MLLLTSTSDLLTVVTGQAVTAIDVHASWVDYAAGTITPGRTNTPSITTATTTTVVASPASSTQRNIKTLNIRNRDAALPCDVTVKLSDGTNNLELIKITLAAGDTLSYSDELGTFFKVPNPVNMPNPGVAVADQVIGASVTNYLTASDLHVSAGRPLKVGTVMRWHVCVIKSAAATAGMTWDLRVGTAGGTGDTSRASLATGTQTAVADISHLFVQVTVRSISASGVIHTLMEMDHNLAATGFWTSANALLSEVTSATFDTTATNLVFGLSLTTGTSHAITVKECVAEFLQGTI